jgi:signal transduction histidine kinase
MSALRIVIIGADSAFGMAVREIVAAQLPDAASEILDPAHLKTRPLADAVVIDARSSVANGAVLAARVRAMGFAGAAVVVCDDPGDRAYALQAAGAAHVAPDKLANQLVPCVGEMLAHAGSEHAPQVMRARRLIAAGEIAMGFQHSLNNPLAGILAEAQLMQLDPLPREQHAALDRIIALCRRIIDLGRSLDGMGERK